MGRFESSEGQDQMERLQKIAVLVRHFSQYSDEQLAFSLAFVQEEINKIKLGLEPHTERPFLIKAAIKQIQTRRRIPQTKTPFKPGEDPNVYQRQIDAFSKIKGHQPSNN